MKKIVAIAAFFLAILNVSHGQTEDLRLGFQVSPMLANMTTTSNTINGDGTNLGLKLGMRAEIYFRENYALLAGLGFSFNSGGTLLYENFSSTWQSSELPPNVTAPFPAGTKLSYDLQYVEIPFGLKFRTKEFGYLRYYVEIPVFTLGFRSQARGEIQYTGVNEDKIDIKDEVNAIAFSWGMGAGIEYSVSDGTAIIAGFDYQNTFTDITQDYSDVDSKGKLNHFVLRLGVMF